MKKYLIHILLLIALGIVTMLMNWRGRDTLYEWRHDWTHGFEDVQTRQEIDALYDALEKVSYVEVDYDYLVQTKSTDPAYKTLLKKLTFLKLRRQDLYKPVVVDFRLKDFLCWDTYYQQLIMGESEYLYCLLNKRLLYKTLELNDELERAGHDPKAFELVNGHRHPAYNEEIGGAKLSRHIKGEAADITIRDINMDGRVTKADKDIVLNILDEIVIGNMGGIGLYPGTDNVHYDVRGTRARWNSF